MSNKRVIGFDADDTLWENEVFFHRAQMKFIELHKHIKDPEEVIFQIEKENIDFYGYGIKGFVLSLIEASVRFSNNQPDFQNIGKVIKIGKDMLAQPIQLLPNVRDTLRHLSEHNTLIMITKGDLLDQQRKVRESGLLKYFRSIEIVSEKNEQTYLEILKKNNISPEDFLMVGNSLKSDILPVTKIGGTGIYIPHKFTWRHEELDSTFGLERFIELKTISDLKVWLKKQI
ncbi:HAD family hydrolase [Paracoccaceae bacterium]|nr:HAD family hydrolase [Paracoccaceae bacterium]